MMLLVAGLTALISVNGAVAALLPVVVVIAVRLGRSPSQLLMPLVFGAHAGSMLALTGTPVNVIVSEAAAEYGGRPFGYFEFALVGIPLVIGTIVIVVLFGERLLPTRTAKGHAHRLQPARPDARRPVPARRRGHAADRPASGLAEVVIPPRSDLVGELVFPGMVTDSGDLVILGHPAQGRGPRTRRGHPRRRRRAPAAGLVDAPSTSTSPIRDVLVVDAPEQIRRQAVPLGLGRPRGDRRPRR